MPTFLSVLDFAARLDVSKGTVRRWLNQGLPNIRLERTIRIPVEEAEAWLRSKTLPVRSRSSPYTVRRTSRRVPREQRTPTFSASRKSSE